MKKQIHIWLAGVMLCVTSLVLAVPDSNTMQLWVRGNECYLVSGSVTPVWPKLPSDVDVNSPLILTITLPSSFQIVAFDSTLKNSAMSPPDLLVPTSVSDIKEANNIIYTVELPAVKNRGKGRLAMLVNPGNAEGDYIAQFCLSTKNHIKTWPSLNASVHVLPALKSQRPKRLRIQIYDYVDYENVAFKQGMMETLRHCGVNQICNMAFSDANNTIAQQLRKTDNMKAIWVWFWHKNVDAIINEYPEARAVDVNGKPGGDICYTWCIQNKDKVKTALVRYIKSRVAGRYDGIINDNEERALTRDRTEVKGDLYTPVTIAEFKKQAGIDPNEKLTPVIILQKYADKWVTFRSWQCAQMSAILSESISEVDLSLDYGYYSGYKHVGKLSDFTRYAYATDWDLLAKEGHLQFGSAGYYGSTQDIASTRKALGEVPYIPAEMFTENFTSMRSAPNANAFTYRLMCALMYGNGGFGIWYHQVLDGAAYSAISQVSAIAAEIEDYLLDGARCDDELVIPPGIDSDAVMAYKLGEKRVVVVFNHSAKTRVFKLSWKNPIIKPDTVEIVSGKNLGSSQILNTELKPAGFAVFVLLSEGN